MECGKFTRMATSGEVAGMPVSTEQDCDIRRFRFWEETACTVRMIKCPRCGCGDPITHVEWTKATSCYPLWFWKECMEPREPDTSS